MRTSPLLSRRPALSVIDGFYTFILSEVEELRPPTKRMIVQAIAPRMKGELTTQPISMNALTVIQPSSAVPAHTDAPMHAISSNTAMTTSRMYSTLTKIFLGITWGFLSLCSDSFRQLEQPQSRSRPLCSMRLFRSSSFYIFPSCSRENQYRNEYDPFWNLYCNTDHACHKLV